MNLTVRRKMHHAERCPSAMQTTHQLQMLPLYWVVLNAIHVSTGDALFWSPVATRCGTGQYLHTRMQPDSDKADLFRQYSTTHTSTVSRIITANLHRCSHCLQAVAPAVCAHGSAGSRICTQHHSSLIAGVCFTLVSQLHACTCSEPCTISGMMSFRLAAPHICIVV